MTKDRTGTEETAPEQSPEEEMITAEELTALKELYMTFITNSGKMHELLDNIQASLAREDEDIVLDSWPTIKTDLAALNAMALQLNRGDFSQSVQDHLQELLQKFTALQALIIAYTPKDQREAKGQKAHEAYTKQ